VAVPEYVALDLETTGLDPARDRVIEVGAVAFTPDLVSASMERLVNPGRAVPEAVLRLTGIKQEELRGAATPEDALRELVRVVRPGGEVKLMLYNRHSIYAVNTWMKYALLHGKPWKSLRWALWNYMESIGTKGHTRKELARMLGSLPLQNIEVHTEITAADYLSASAFPPLNFVFRTCLRLAGQTFGWHPSQYLERVNAPGKTGKASTGF